MSELTRQMDLLLRGVTEVIQPSELESKLARALKEHRPLRVKAGFDPTAPDIHLGHTVLLRKLRHFQECGHKVIFLIGDATALVGDPSGQTVTRKTMTEAQIARNAETYEQQIGKILDVKSRTLFERRHNNEWFKTFSFKDIVTLGSKYTVARLLERDDFQKRLKENRPISYLETFYPLMQGYDSVMLKSDVELGGTDQKFNLLVGRELQREYGQEPQVVLTMPLLEGLDGVQKMSKSLNNHIGINEPPNEMFGKIMSISDEMMWKYYELLTDEPLASVKKLHPMEAKKQLGENLVSQYHGAQGAKKAKGHFESAFQKEEFPKDATTLKPISRETLLIDLLSDASMANLGSKSVVRQKIREGAVYVEGKRVRGFGFKLLPGYEYRIKVGKKLCKVPSR